MWARPCAPPPSSASPMVLRFRSAPNKAVTRKMKQTRNNRTGADRIRPLAETEVRRISLVGAWFTPVDFDSKGDVTRNKYSVGTAAGSKDQRRIGRITLGTGRAHSGDLQALGRKVEELNFLV